MHSTERRPPKLSATAAIGLRQPDRPSLGAADEAGPDGIDRVILHMKAAYAAELPHRELSRMAGMTASHFSYAFRKRTGQRPMDYLSDLRIAESKRLLHPQGFSVKDAAQRVGFADEYYFSRRFKQHVGVSPAFYARIRRSEKRTIALTYTGQMLALGLKPLGAPRQHLANRGFDRLKAGIADIGDFMRIDPESIAGLRPDLILVSEGLTDWDRHEARLKRIAPIAVVSWDKDDVFGHLRQVAGLLDREKEAAAWLEAHEEQVGRAREAIRPYVEPAETVTFLRISTDYIGLWGERAFGHALYRSLGLRPPAAVADLMDGGRSFASRRLELHELGRYVGDMLFFSVTEDSASEAYFARLSAERAWGELAAVKRKRVFRVSDTKWKFYEPRAVAAQLADAVRLLSCPPC